MPCNDSLDSQCNIPYDTGMERTFTYQISESEAGMEVRTFLRAQGYSRHILASMKPIPDAVLVNGVHVYMRYAMQAGDVLTVRVRDTETSEHVVPAPVPFSVVFEDEDILIVDKPARVAIHPAINHPANTLANGVVWYYEQQGIPFVFRCINRLDRDTTGLLIVAKNLVSASILETALQKHEIHRTYLAVVEGILPKSGTIDLPIARKEGSLIERCVDQDRGEHAVTHYRRIDAMLCRKTDAMLPLSAKEKPALSNSVVELHLETGRTHQIRVHMAAIGHPLLGDSLYNPHITPLYDKETPRPGVPLPYGLTRQALHSHKLDFIHPITKEPMHFEAPVPEDMQLLIG